MMLLELESHVDGRGSLVPLEFRDLPFTPKRSFVVSGGSFAVRGEHAHRTCWEALVCVAGKVEAVAINQEGREGVVLESPTQVFVIPPMTWVEQLYHEDSVLMVLASHEYDEDDYIEDWDEYKALVGL